MLNVYLTRSFKFLSNILSRLPFTFCRAMIAGPALKQPGQCINFLRNRQQAELAAGKTKSDRTTYDSLRQMQTYGKL